MKLVWLTLLPLVTGVVVAAAQNSITPPSTLPTTMQQKGAPIKSPAPGLNFPSSKLRELRNTLPTAQLSKLARQPLKESKTQSRGAKDQQIYKSVSHSVVLILTNDGLGSGALISTSGDVITNWHVISGYDEVVVVFKPSIEGQEPTRDDMRVGHVVKYDQVADLALVRVADPPKERMPMRLGETGEINIGADVHAIGHPTGEIWTYTKGVISQYRLGYEWQIAGMKHRADVIQTQTPINPGNSGGPLIGDSGTLIGVNSLKGSGEGLNYAISVDTVKAFLRRTGNRTAPNVAPSKPVCEPKEIDKWRNKEDDATVTAYDIGCTGAPNAHYVVPDKTSEPITLMIDRNGDGQPDVVFFDFQRREKWDLSFWDENFDGHWTLVGYHKDGSLTPDSFESYEAFKKRASK